MRAQVVERRAPLAGTLVYSWPEGSTDAVGIGFDLDVPDTEAKVVSNDGPDAGLVLGSDYFDSHQVTLERDERLTFRAFAVASTCLCDFTIELRLADGSTMSIDEAGNPWRVSGFADKYERTYFMSMAETGAVIEPCDWPAGCLRRESNRPG